MLILNRKALTRSCDTIRNEICVRVEASEADAASQKAVLELLTVIDGLPLKKRMSALSHLSSMVTKAMPYICSRAAIHASGSSFLNAVSRCRDCASNVPATEMPKVYDFFMKAIRLNIKHDYLTEVLYGFPSFETAKVRINSLPIPEYYFDSGEKHSIFEHCSVREYSVPDHCFVSVPDVLFRIGKFLNTREPIEINENYMLYLNGGIDLGFAFGDNNHRLAVLNMSSGRVRAKTIDAPQLFPFVDTDGIHWRDRATGAVLGTVKDFRVAVLYELARDVCALS